MGRATPHARQLRIRYCTLLAADRSQHRMLTHRDRSHLARAKTVPRCSRSCVNSARTASSPNLDGMQRRAIVPNRGQVGLNRRAHHT
jgi:hypothetical protein